MNCEWHGDRHPATWWAEPVRGPMSWMCDEMLHRIGKKDPEGKYIAIPAEERLAEIHKEPGRG